MHMIRETTRPRIEYATLRDQTLATPLSNWKFLTVKLGEGSVTYGPEEHSMTIWSLNRRKRVAIFTWVALGLVALLFLLMGRRFLGESLIRQMAASPQAGDLSRIVARLQCYEKTSEGTF